MIWLLRYVFGGVLTTMLCVTRWAGARVPLWSGYLLERLLLRQRA
jgi:DMSO/TMAO reductase YedYZ molybdopterin-dependent catalytic subunit